MKVPSEVSFALDYNEELFQFINDRIVAGEDWIEVPSASSGSTAVVLNNPAWVKHVLQTNNKNYVKGMGIEKIKMLLGNGIMVSEGSFWLRQRRMVQTCFQRDFFKKYFGELVRLNEELVARWVVQGPGALNLNREMGYLSLNAILRAIFSDDVDVASNNSPFHILSEETTRDLRFAKKFRNLHQLVDSIIERRRREDRWPDDFLSALVSVKNKEDGLGMAPHELNDEIITLIVAGHETTASTLTWCWHLLMQNQVVYEQLLDEVGALAVVDFEGVMKLEVVRRILQEAMRLYPAGWLMSRRALQDDRVGDRPIRGGTDVLLSLYALHRHPRLWTEPDKFNPDRFREPAELENTFLPFSMGPRKCIGDSLALLEMQVHLAMVSRQLRLSREDEDDVGLEPHINLRPKRPIFVRALVLK